jgi:hypothetical protein
MCVPPFFAAPKNRKHSCNVPYFAPLAMKLFHGTQADKQAG